MTYNKYAILFKALSDGTRIEIIEMISSGEMCACKILEKFDITQPTLSYHMKILSDCGLVKARREGAWMFYSIENEKFEVLSEFINKFKV